MGRHRARFSGKFRTIGQAISYLKDTVSNTLSAPLKRVLSGMRPTGKLHLGNYMGALHNWVRLQHEYDCYFFIADWHALTTDYADPTQVQENIFQITLDFLSAGLDPGRCVIFKQSDVMQHDRLT